MTRVNILSASAGAGKTFRLVLKYICDVLTKPECYRNILAVTFTNKATEEMKSRIINELHNLADGKKSDYLVEIMTRTGYDQTTIRQKAAMARTQILHNYSQFTVLTIDRFFQRILRAFINELSLDLDYNIELDTSMLLERSADALIDSIAKSDNDNVKDWLMTFAKERLEAGDRWDMRRDLCTLGNELFKNGIAKRLSAGVDKEELETIVKEHLNKTNDIVNQIKELASKGYTLLKQNNLTAKNFKGRNPSFITCFEMYANGEIGAGPTETIKNAAFGDISKWCGKDEPDACIIAPKLQSLLQEICNLYDANFKDINTSELLNKNYRSYALLSDLHKSFTSICQKENIMVLDETKELLAEFIDEVNAPFIYEKVGNRYNRYMIDEFQDTSTREWRNLRPLLIEALSSDTESSVFIVGDIKQSIYRWRGGDWRLLNQGVSEDLKLYNPTVEPLARNRRSLENVIIFNNNFIQKIADLDNEHINGQLQNNELSQTTKAEYTDIIKSAYADSTQEVHKVGKQGIAEVTLFNPKLTTPPFIETIKNAISRGYRYKDILILVRSATDASKVAKALYDYKLSSNADFNILTSDALTIDSCDVVKFIIALMRLAIDTHNDVERGIYNGYLMQHAKSEEQKRRHYGSTFSDEELQLLSDIAHLSALEAFELIVKHFKLNDEVSHIAYLQAVHEQILAFSSTHASDIQHYLSWWDEKGHKESLSVEKTDNTIEITTIHKSKGLEREVVIIPYCKWGMTPNPTLHPIVWANSAASNPEVAKIGSFPVTYGPTMKESAFSEEYWREYVMSHVDGLNLLYVAVTRAKNELYIFVPCSLDPKSKANPYSDISGLIKSGIKDKMLKAGEVQFAGQNVNDGKIVYEKYVYGAEIKPYTPKSEAQTQGNSKLVEYPTHASKVNVYNQLERMTKEGAKAGSKSCNNGIKMHKMFENANTFDDLHKAVDLMLNNAAIRQKRADSLHAKIDSFSKNSLVAEWFSGDWDDVKCETELLCNGKSLRPDRVMIKDSKAVIVDYKFVAQPNLDHHHQVEEYIKLLTEMGTYDNIEGYVWYVDLDQIVRV